MPMPARPNTTVTGLYTFAPFAGLTMYSLAPAGEGVRAMAGAAAGGVCVVADSMAEVPASSTARGSSRDMESSLACGLRERDGSGAGREFGRREIIHVDDLHDLAIIVQQQGGLIFS